MTVSNITPSKIEYYHHIKALIAEARKKYAERYAAAASPKTTLKRPQLIAWGEVEFHEKFLEITNDIVRTLARHNKSKNVEAYLGKFQSWYAATGTVIFKESQVPEKDFPGSIDIRGPKLDSIERTLLAIIEGKNPRFSLLAAPDRNPRIEPARPVRITGGKVTISFPRRGRAAGVPKPPV